IRSGAGPGLAGVGLRAGVAVVARRAVGLGRVGATGGRGAAVAGGRGRVARGARGPGGAGAGPGGAGGGAGGCGGAPAGPVVGLRAGVAVVACRAVGDVGVDAPGDRVAAVDGARVMVVAVQRGPGDAGAGRAGLVAVAEVPVVAQRRPFVDLPVAVVVLAVAD